MARKKGAETPGKWWCVNFPDHLFTLVIIVLSLLMLALTSCARGGGTPIAETPKEAGVLDSSTTPETSIDTGLEEPATPFCGNGKLEPEINEQCDREDLGGATCATLSDGQEEGDLGCTADCTFNTIMCYPVIQESGSGGDPGTGGNYGEP